ncbi:type III-B CRISPR module RAMP protein Cmr6 [Deltaproteobacteria bacterium TL4]
MIEAIRTDHQFISGLRVDNLGLRIDKFNESIDEHQEHQTKDKSLALLANFRMSPSLKESYQYAFHHWVNTMRKREHDTISFDILSLTKILLGTGNASVFEFGFHLNKPWGVPYIPGSTLKGILSAWLSKQSGEAWSRSSKNTQKSANQVELFGGEFDKKSYVGSVTFFDAWMHPEDRWFEEDIINVHHQKYYSGERLPDGTENPIPVKIAALRSGLKFFVSLQGPDKSLFFLRKALKKVLSEEGLGGKTSVGYGRFQVLWEEELKRQEQFRLELQKRQQAEKARQEQEAELKQRNLLKWNDRYLEDTRKSLIKPDKVLLFFKSPDLLPPGETSVDSPEQLTMQKQELGQQILAYWKKQWVKPAPWQKKTLGELQQYCGLLTKTKTIAPQ